MSVTIIAAIARNNCIGKNGAIPWHLPEDMNRFKKLTTGRTVIMGRKTWESLPERFRPLPDRTNIVLTRQANYPLPPGVERFSSLIEALAAHETKSIFVIGGADVYAQAMPLANRLEITRVDQDVDGDTFFPPIDESEWTETQRWERDGFTFLTYE